MTLELVAGEQNPLVRGVVTGIYRSVSYRGAGCGEIGGAAQVELLPGRPGNRWLTIRYEGAIPGAGTCGARLRRELTSSC